MQELPPILVEPPKRVVKVLLMLYKLFEVFKKKSGSKNCEQGTDNWHKGLKK